jgi:hypothetical protein
MTDQFFDQSNYGRTGGFGHAARYNDHGSRGSGLFFYKDIRIDVIPGPSF